MPLLWSSAIIAITFPVVWLANSFIILSASHLIAEQLPPLIEFGALQYVFQADYKAAMTVGFIAACYNTYSFSNALRPEASAKREGSDVNPPDTQRPIDIPKDQPTVVKTPELNAYRERLLKPIHLLLLGCMLIAFLMLLADNRNTFQTSSDCVLATLKQVKPQDAITARIIENHCSSLYPQPESR